ncbi:unnamed protein product [Cuscuta europaea]|uniref:Uncharacterized protein n=1 Tax=Cuscuta europaea TaxID=41803 RepID=A0A9P0YYH9_CUSEU|nr:unnamed protein product [Cuscuta europaea]
MVESRVYQVSFPIPPTYCLSFLNESDRLKFRVVACNRFMGTVFEDLKFLGLDLLSSCCSLGSKSDPDSLLDDKLLTITCPFISSPATVATLLSWDACKQLRTLELEREKRKRRDRDFSNGIDFGKTLPSIYSKVN